MILQYRLGLVGLNSIWVQKKSWISADGNLGVEKIEVKFGNWDNVNYVMPVPVLLTVAVGMLFWVY